MNKISDRLVWVKEEFDRIAIGGVLGDSDGKPAFGYLRVSSTGQAEEGRGGFPRQLQHVHEKAQDLGLAIPWDLVYFDDHTGFEFRDRPALTRLRNLIRSQPRPADYIVIENIDRLSREATWQQGFLLDELENEYKVHIHFWKELGSKLERVVYGTISQDRMLTDLERMAAGNRHKAKSGRVTARTSAYGYRFVNAQGGQENIKKDTYYAIAEPEASVVRMMYRWLLEERATLVDISRRLMERNIKTPQNGLVWDPTKLRAIIKNTVYKGEFYAHRYVHVERISMLTGKPVTHKIQRPCNEWILVPVPALVTPDVWEEAQAVMRENRTLSLRNAKREYLLASLVYCAECREYKMSGGGHFTYRETAEGQKRYESSQYRCARSNTAKHLQKALGVTCTMPQIASKRLDNLVWNTVVHILLDRHRLEERLERYFSQQQGDTAREEVAFVQGQLTELTLEDERLYRAYQAGAFEAAEFAQKRFVLKEQQKRLEDEKERLQQRLASQVRQEEWKQQLLEAVEVLRQQAEQALPFELKRRILMQVVDKITVDTREQWFQLEGTISGKLSLSSSLCKWLPLCNYIGNRPANRIAS
jgi:site-specific DNA recombinase